MNSVRDPLSGDWQHLADPAQTPRYDTIRGLIRPGSRVLDLGCGMAVLASQLPDCDYVGIEPSDVAAAEARKRTDRPIMCETAEGYMNTGKPFDAIVFNEMLYYTRDPIALLNRYAGMIAPGGIFIVSIFQKKSSFGMWLRWFFNRNRAMSNLRCSRLVERHFARRGWTSRVALATPWRILEVSP